MINKHSILNLSEQQIKQEKDKLKELKIFTKEYQKEVQSILDEALEVKKGNITWSRFLINN